jgi:predicted RNA methylase
MCSLSDYEDMELTDYSRRVLTAELDSWHSGYLPVRGTVLDLGAGCGETVRFYLLHGAKKVIAVECYEPAYEMLCRNFEGDTRVTPILAQIDKIKIDVEGAEEDLDLEIHFDYEWVKTNERYGQVEQWRLKKIGAMRGFSVLDKTKSM